MDSMSNRSIENLLANPYSDITFAASLESMTNLLNLVENYQKAPSLLFLAGNDDKLKMFAKNIHLMCSQTDTISFTSLDLKNLETIISVFSNELIRSVDNEQKENSAPPKESTNANTETEKQDNSAQIMKYEKEIFELKEKLKSLQEKYSMLSDEKDDLAEQVLNDDNYKKQMSFKLNDMKVEKERTIAQLMKENEDLKQQIKAQKGKDMQNEFANRRLSDKCEELAGENARLRSELTKTGLKLDQKRKKLNEMRTQQQQIEINRAKKDSDYQHLLAIANEYKNRCNKYEAQLKQTRNESSLSESRTNISKQSNIVEKLTEAFNNQANELEEATQKQAKMVKIIMKLMNLAEFYESKFEETNKESRRSNKNMDDLKTRISELAKNLEEMKEENQTLQEKAANNEELNEIGQIVEKQQNETTLDAVKRIKESSNNKELIEMNTRLISLLETQMKNAFSSISGDKQINDLNKACESERRKCEEFIEANQLSDNRASPQTSEEIVRKMINDGTIQSKELIALFTAQVETSALLRKQCEKLKEELEFREEQEKTIARSIDFKGEESELTAEIIDKLNETDVMTQKIMNLLGKEKSDHPLNEVFDSIVEINRILEQFDTSVRKTVEYDGDINELPQFVCTFIEKLKEKIHECENKKEENIPLVFGGKSQAEFDAELIESFKIDLERLQKKIQDVTKEKEQVELQNQQLIQQLNEKDQQLSTFLHQSSFVDQIRDNISLRTEETKKENERLKHRLNELSVDYNRKVKELEDKLQEEKQDLKERLESTHQIQINRIQDDLSAKSAKLKQTKDKLREVAKAYENAFRQQKESYLAVKKQNTSLVKTVEQLRREIMETPNREDEIKEINETLKNKEVENKLLQNKLNQLKQQNETIKDVTEQYWKSQLQMQKMKTEKQADEQKKEEIVKHAKFVNEISSILMIDDNDSTEESIVSTVANLKNKLESSSSSSSLLAKKSQLLKEWDSWGRNMYVLVCNQLTPGKTANDIRNVLTELITSAGSKKKFMKKLESLRTQKQFLLAQANDKLSNKKHENLSIRNLLIAAMFIKRITKP